MSVVIRGVGAVSAVGPSAKALRDAIFSGRDGIEGVTRFDTTPFSPVHLGACVAEGSSCVAWAVAAAREAWDDATLHEDEVRPERIAVVAGTTEGEEGDIPGIARAVAAEVGAKGPVWTISTACTSSANAIGLAMDLLTLGDADVVVAGGAERLLPEMFAGFYQLGVLAEAPCSPFGETRGTTLGEGSGFIVLSRTPAEGRVPWGYLHGYGLASDGWHETTPEPRGAGIARAMLSALAASGLDPSAVDYVNVHGTGTATNDDAEWRGIQSALGSRAGEIPVSATKSILGHAQGAAGVLELIATLVCRREGTLPPTLRVGRGRPAGPPDPIDSDRPRSAQATHFLANSAAFGGANAVLCVGGEPVSGPMPAARSVHITGIGLVGFADGEARDESRLVQAHIDLRGTDPSARFSLAACHAALVDAGVRVRGALRMRAGVFAGSSRVSPTSLLEYRESIERGGLSRCSASAFSRLVLHAPAGTVSRLLSLRGPTTTVAADGIAGLMAFAYASDTCMRRDDADLMLALAFDERSHGTHEAEGAACLCMQVDRGAGPRVVAVASGGGNALGDMVALALSRAGRSRGDVASWHVSDSPASNAPSLASAKLVVDAARAVRAGAAVSVAAAQCASASCAIVLLGDRDLGREA